MLGSHLDTVRDAGKYDGMLGVVSALECVQALHGGGRRLPHAVEVIGFADEEGVRFGTTLLGSRAVAGTFTPQLLDARDAAGITMRQALEDVGARRASDSAGRPPPRGSARLRRAAHRAGAGAGGGRAAGGRGHRHQRLHPAARDGEGDRGPRGHGAHGNAPRRAGRRRRVRARGRAHRRGGAGPGRHRRPHRGPARRDQRDPGRGALHDRRALPARRAAPPRRRCDPERASAPVRAARHERRAARSCRTARRRSARRGCMEQLAGRDQRLTACRRRRFRAAPATTASP